MRDFKTCHLKAGQHLPQNAGKDQTDLARVAQSPVFTGIPNAPAVLITKYRYRSPREGIHGAHLVEQLHKTGPSPWQVRADLKGKAGGFPGSPGRGAGKSSARAQRCGMPAPASTRSLPGLCTGSGLLPLPRAGGDKQGARHSWSFRSLPCSGEGRKQRALNKSGAVSRPAPSAVLPTPAPRSSASFLLQHRCGESRSGSASPARG